MVSCASQATRLYGQRLKFYLKFSTGNPMLHEKPEYLNTPHKTVFMFKIT